MGSQPGQRAAVRRREWENYPTFFVLFNRLISWADAMSGTPSRSLPAAIHKVFWFLETSLRSTKNTGSCLPQGVPETCAFSRLLLSIVARGKRQNGHQEGMGFPVQSLFLLRSGQEIICLLFLLALRPFSTSFQRGRVGFSVHTRMDV